MIFCVIKNNAGPGNQMFMYAYAYALAKKYGHRIWICSEISRFSVRQNVLQHLSLDRAVICGFLRLDGIRHFLPYRILRKLIFDLILKFPVFHRIEQPAAESRRILTYGKLKRHRLYVTDGYWECPVYSAEFRAELERQIRPAYALPAEIEKTAAEIRLKESVSVHIRKGDFEAFGRLISDSYYDAAMEKLRKELKRPVFYILSEDERVRARYAESPDCRILDFHTPNKYLDEWFVLKQCRHHIIANSTYSWWSAYLSEYPGKRVLIPDPGQYLAAESGSDPALYLNYYPEAWRLNEADPGICSRTREKPLFAFVILHYCSESDTTTCMDTVRQFAPDCPVVIADNASPDGSGRRLLEKYRDDPRTTVILNPENGGYSAGNNIGIRYARTKLKADFVTVLNPDTRMIQPDFTARILAEYAHSRFAVLGPRVLDPSGRNDSSPLRDGESCSVSVLRRIRLSRRRQYCKALLGLSGFHPFAGRNRVQRYKAPADSQEQIQKQPPDTLRRQTDVQLHGCCLIFSPEYFRYFPGFEERTFMYGEETILKMNLKRAGLHTVYLPELKIFHRETAASERNFASRKERILYLKRMSDAAEAIYRKAKTEMRNSEASGYF